MSEQLLTILKLCLLALLYLFFFRVLRAVWAEVNPPRAAEAPAKKHGKPTRRVPTRRGDGKPVLRIAPVTWGADGWPVVGKMSGN